MNISSDIAAIAKSNGLTQIATVDYSVGVAGPTASLKSFTSLTSKDGIYYNKALNTLVITKDGATFDGYNFSGVSINVTANNVTFKNSYFDSSAGLYAINAFPGTKNLTVDHSTFDGLKSNSLAYVDLLTSRGENTVITNSAFLNAPTDAISIVSGVVQGNYIAGAAYAAGAHADAIWVAKSIGPVVISNNVIDWRSSADAPSETNNAIRVTGEAGNVSDVLVQNNIILGGSNSVLVSDGATQTHTAAQVGTVTGVSVINNVIDYGKYGDVSLIDRPDDMVYANNIHASGVSVSVGKEVVGALPDLASLNKIVAATPGAAIYGTPKGDYIVGGTLSNSIYGSSGNDVIVGGGGRDYIRGGAGSDIFVYNSLKDSGTDLIYDFTKGSDRIYLASLDGAPTATSGWQWIGDQRFTGHEWQLRASYASGYTTIQIDADGDLVADFTLQLTGKIDLSSSDFILVDRSSLPPALTVVDASTSLKVALGSATSFASGSGVLSGASHQAVVTSIAGAALGSIIQGLYGQLTMASDGSYTYTRTAGSIPAAAVETFAYVIKDIWGQTASAKLLIDLLDPNNVSKISGDFRGQMTEDTATVGTAGVIKFADPDVSDKLVVSTAGGSVKLTDTLGVDRTNLLDAATLASLKAGFALSNGDLGSNAGSVGWSYSTASTAFDFLGRGETAAITTVVKVDDGHGGTALQNVVVTVVGTNDAPVFSAVAPKVSVVEPAGHTGSATTVTQQGTLGFADLDLTDTHVVSVSMASSGYVGSFSAAIASDTTGGGNGVINWTFTATDKALDFLGAGQTVDQIFRVALSDGKGGLVRQDVVVTLVGTDDLPVITGSTGATWYEGSATNHLKTGVLTFVDPDLTDHVTTSIGQQSVSLVSAAGVDMTSSLSDPQLAALKAAFSMPVGDLGSNKGSAAWSYAVADTALDFLGQNDVLKVVSQVQANDGHGGVTTQDVTMTLKGINDAPVITGTSGVTGGVVETAGVSGSAALLATTGAFQFADADLSDAHSVRVTAKGTGYLGTFTPVVSQDTTGGGTGTVNWTFQVADKALDGLAAGQIVTQTYSVAIYDGKGGLVNQDVKVTLTGTSDQFVFTMPTAKALPSFAAGDTLGISASSFGGGLKAGALDASFFSDTASATVSGHGQFYQDAAHKTLYWDVDGTGSKAPVTIASFASAHILHHSDIMVL